MLATESYHLGCNERKKKKFIFRRRKLELLYYHEYMVINTVGFARAEIARSKSLIFGNPKMQAIGTKHIKTSQFV